jgi:hypothetical protein
MVNKTGKSQKWDDKVVVRRNTTKDEQGSSVEIGSERIAHLLDLRDLNRADVLSKSYCSSDLGVKIWGKED